MNPQPIAQRPEDAEEDDPSFEVIRLERAQAQPSERLPRVRAKGAALMETADSEARARATELVRRLNRERKERELRSYKEMLLIDEKIKRTLAQIKEKCSVQEQRRRQEGEAKLEQRVALELRRKGRARQSHATMAFVERLGVERRVKLSGGAGRAQVGGAVQLQELKMSQQLAAFIQRSKRG